MNILNNIKAKLTCSAVINRADGTVEDLGVLSSKNLSFKEIIRLLLFALKLKTKKW